MPTPKKKPIREKLTTVLPSGQKEDNFFELVHAVARQIPKGRVTTYGAIADALGARRSARPVGGPGRCGGTGKARLIGSCESLSHIRIMLNS